MATQAIIRMDILRHHLLHLNLKKIDFKVKKKVSEQKEKQLLKKISFFRQLRKGVLFSHLVVYQ